MFTTHDDMLRVSDDLLARGWQAFAELPAALETRQRRLTDGERILGAFLMKMLSTFEALVDDVRNGRGESMHHLKTLCESFIYLIEAISSEVQADLVLARSYDSQRRYLDAKTNANDGNREKSIALQARIDELTAGRGVARETVEEVARRHLNLPGWYDVVYRLACQPAHLGDLEDFMPGDDGVFPEGAGAGRSIDAIGHGLEIMLWLVSFVNETNEIGIRIQIDGPAQQSGGR